MPSNSIVRITDDKERIAPRALAQLQIAHRTSCQLAGFDDDIADLARTLSTVAATDLDAALEPTLAMLGLGLRADHVHFYVAEPLPHSAHSAGDARFNLRSSWAHPGARGAIGAPPTSIDLDAFADRGRALGQGASRRLASWPRADRVWDTIELAGPDPSCVSRTLLLLPCLSAAGLNGFFALDAGLAASAWSREFIARSELVARQFALVLERHALTLELDRVRKKRGHEERLETLGRMASGVAHDFNNVLTAILGYADLLEGELAERGVDLGPGRSDLDEIREAAERAGDLAEQILSVGRSRERKDAPIELDTCVSGFASMIRRVLGEDVQLSLDLGLDPPGAAEIGQSNLASSGSDGTAGAPSVRLDPSGFERVLLNLASNARGALRDVTDEPRFEIATRTVCIDEFGRDRADPGSEPIRGLLAGEHVRLSARDNGCGMDPELVDRIFEPFFTTRGDSGGTGLGLATTAEVVREGGGGIRVETAPGEGAVFHLYFPVDGRATPGVRDGASASASNAKRPERCVAGPPDSPRAPHS